MCVDLWHLLDLLIKLKMDCSETLSLAKSNAMPKSIVRSGDAENEIEGLLDIASLPCVTLDDLEKIIVISPITSTIDGVDQPRAILHNYD